MTDRPQVPHEGKPWFADEHVGLVVLSGVSDAIVASDHDGVICFWNAGAERIFGYAAAEALRQSLDLIIPERLRACHWHGYRQVIATGESRYAAGDLLSVPAMRKDGSMISVEFTITPVQSADGRIEGLIAVMRDVTARFEEMKALKQKIRTLTPP